MHKFVNVKLSFLFAAEFIIDIADKNPTFDSFKKALVENGAEFSDSFMTNLLRIIQHMKPANNPSQKGETSSESSNPLANKFPGLAIPNEKPPHFSSDEESEEEKDEKKTKRLTSKDIFKNEAKTKTNDSIVDQAMAELEALAPSNVTSAPVKEPLKKEKENIKEEVKKRERSRSRDRKDSSKKRERSRDRRDVKKRRSKSRDRRSRSRDRRSRSRDRDRDRRRRSRSRPTSSRHRSRDRHRRSRSRGKRSPSREREREDRYDDYKKPRKRSPEVEMSDDPEPGKVSTECEKIKYYSQSNVLLFSFNCFLEIFLYLKYLHNNCIALFF